MITLFKICFRFCYRVVYYCLYPFVWFYRRYFGYSAGSTEGIDFEYTCANILRGRGFTNVEVTKASGDQGIDVLASKGGQRYAIQCKLYSNPVSNSAVQEAYAGMTYYGCSKAAVMTNSTFTASARELADSIGVELWDNTPTSSKRERSPWVFWLSLVAAIAYIVYLEKTLSISEDEITSKQANVLLIWTGFILFYVFVFPAIKRIILSVVLRKSIEKDLKKINQQLEDVEAEIDSYKAKQSDNGLESESIKYTFDADHIDDENITN